MGLPVLNDKPKYQMIIPSTGKKVNFRPYLVKEEKILLMAAETQDIKQMINAIIDTISACVYDKVDKSTLTTFDLEYMFIAIRAKSVGEIVDLKLKCSTCGTENDYKVNLDNVTCKSEKELSNIIELTDKVSVEMKYPGYDAIDFTTDEKEMGFEVIEKSIHAVMTEDEKILLEDESKESITNFLESLTKDQFEKLIGYIDSIPQVKYDATYTCRNCGSVNEETITGMRSFF